MNRLTLWISTVVVSFLAMAAQAQTVKVNVIVVDDFDEPIHSAMARIQGNNISVAPNAEGHLWMEVPRGSVVEFFSMGFETKAVRVDKPLTGKILLQEKITEFKQVVVNGYTQTDIRKATGSVGILTEKDLKDQPLANVDMLMQGKLTGVNVQAVSGRPGESAKVRVRGISSITGNNEPLWVIDGVPIQKNIPMGGGQYVRNGDFSTLYANGVAGISPVDIESITVLKDAAAAAIYGSQAQAGVIVITTKRGKAGKTRINYSGSVSIQTAPSRDHNLMNSAEKIAYEESIWNEFSAAGYAAGKDFPRIGIVGQVRSGYKQFEGMTTAEQDAYLASLSQTNTDWFQVLMHNTVSTSHNVSLSGGSDKLTYYVSGGMNTNKGVIKKSSSDGYNFSAKITAHPSERITMNFSADYSYLKSLGASSGFDIFKYAYFANPYEKPYNNDGSYAEDNTYFSMPYANNSTYGILPPNGVNVLREINGTTTTGISSSTTLRGDLTWRISDHFRLYGLAAYTYSNDGSDNEVGQDTYCAWMDRPFEGSNLVSRRIYGNMTQFNNYNRGWIARAQLNYSQTFNKKHYVSALFGSEVRSNYAKSFFRKVYGYDPVTGNFSNPILQNNSGTYTLEEMQQYQNILNSLSGQARTEEAFASFYGALDYILMNKYIFNLTARTDGSNNFGSKEQFNVTWSTGLGWNIDEEKFMQPLKRIISHATLRLSCGLTGGVNKTVYPVLIMSYLGSFRNNETEAFRMGNIRNAPNDHLRWEHTQDWNGSLDLGFLRDRLNTTLSFYRRNGYDLVTPVRVVSTTGFDTQSYNTSSQLNQGVELMISGTPVKTRNWTWSASFNISYNQNVLTEYESPTGSIFGDIYVNYPQGKIFTGKPAGIDPETGLYTYQLRKDANQKDLYGFENYVYYIGTSNYPWTGGFSTNVSWKNLTLSISTSFALNAYIMNNINAVTSYSNLSKSSVNTIANPRYDLYSAHLNVVKDAAYRWTPDNPVTDGYPRLIDAYGSDLGLNYSQVNSSTIQNGVFYEKTSYLKINGITLTYNLPQQWTKRIAAEQVGVSFTANNLWILTNYSGMNPETPGAVYPMSRNFSIGLNIGF